MVFWLLAIAVTAIACAALYYASAGRAVNVTAAGADVATTAHFRAALREIDADIATGRLAAAEALAARGELARELIRQEAVASGNAAVPPQRGTAMLPFSVLAVAVLALAVYSVLGAPHLPSLPLDGRVDRPAETVDLQALAAAVEEQLLITPDDPRALEIATSVFMQAGRFDDAATTLRHRMALQPVTADLETDLAEAVLMTQGGDIAGEPMALLKRAAARDPVHVRSRFYLAGEATRIGDSAAAVGQWTELLALAKGDEPWLPMARNGLAIAEAGLSGANPTAAENAAEAAAIRGMVEGLSDRLLADGGPLGDWTQLVRSRIVLGEAGLAQTAYDAAKAAYPDAAARAELDALAANAGLR